MQTLKKETLQPEAKTVQMYISRALAHYQNRVAQTANNQKDSWNNAEDNSSNQYFDIRLESFVAYLIKNGVKRYVE